TNITNNTLVMDQNGTYEINWRGGFVANLASQRFRVVLNASTVISTETGNNVVGQIASQALSLGDTLELQAFSGGIFGNTLVVQQGSTITYLEAVALSTPWTGEATQTINWDRTAAASISADIAADGTDIAWQIDAEMGWEGQLPADRGIVWGIDADLYQGQHYDGGAAVTIGWDIEADMALIPD